MSSSQPRFRLVVRPPSAGKHPEFPCARHELERILVEGDEAFVTYLCIARDGKRFRNTEFFSFAGDKVKRIDGYFGASYQDGKFVPQSR